MRYDERGCGLSGRDALPPSLDSAVQQYFTSTMVPDASREQAESLNEQQRLSCDGEHAAALMLARASLDVRAEAAALRNALSALYARLQVEGRAQAIVRIRDGGSGTLPRARDRCPVAPGALGHCNRGSHPRRSRSCSSNAPMPACSR
ncbi:hypothetical protein [Aquabacterium sp.]|uniref:hypothetical protein n=1 Tax=Aquabacterium sp. TaxID=1872578 RepID=UPI003783F994